MINFKCSCGKELKVPDTLARKVVTCNQCGRKNIQLPGAGEKLDLSDYELEDINAGTIVLEPPGALSSISPRKPLKNQPEKRKPERKESKVAPEGKSRRVPRRNERPEPEPEPEEEFEDEPARPARRTRRLEEKKQEAPAPAAPRSERPSKRAAIKKVLKEVEDDNSPLKAKSSQIVIETLEKLVEELKEDEQETVDDVKAAKRGRSGRGDRGSNRGSEKRGAKGKKSRDEDEDDYKDYGNSQKFLYVIIGAIVLIGIGLFFYFKPKDPVKTTTVVAPVTADAEKAPEKVVPKVAPPKYEKITEEGERLLGLFNITGENKNAISKALEEKRTASVTRKMSSKNYDSYIQVIIKQKLAYALAIQNILDTVKFDDESHKHILYTLHSFIDSISNINQDKDYMKGFPLDLNAAKITWDKEKLVEFLEKTKKDFSNEMDKKEIVTTPIEWKHVVDIVVNGKVDDDTTDIQIPN